MNECYSKHESSPILHPPTSSYNSTHFSIDNKCYSNSSNNSDIFSGSKLNLLNDTESHFNDLVYFLGISPI